MPWWWHTSDDTIDKIDPDVLVLDTKIYVSTLWRLCHDPLLPMDFRPVVTDIQDTLQQLRQIAGNHLDLSVTQKRANHLAELPATCHAPWRPGQDRPTEPLTACPPQFHLFSLRQS